MSQHLQRGKINMKVMKGMQIKLGDATNRYIYVTLLLWQQQQQTTTTTTT